MLSLSTRLHLFEHVIQRKRVGDHGHSQTSESSFKAKAVRAATAVCSSVRACRCCLDVFVRRRRMTIEFAGSETSISETCRASTS